MINTYKIYQLKKIFQYKNGNDQHSFDMMVYKVDGSTETPVLDGKLTDGDKKNILPATKSSYSTDAFYYFKDRYDLLFVATASDDSFSRIYSWQRWNLRDRDIQNANEKEVYIRIANKLSASGVKVEIKQIDEKKKNSGYKLVFDESNFDNHKDQIKSFVDSDSEDDDSGDKVTFSDFNDIKNEKYKKLLKAGLEKICKKIDEKNKEDFVNHFLQLGEKYFRDKARGRNQIMQIVMILLCAGLVFGAIGAIVLLLLISFHPVIATLTFCSIPFSIILGLGIAVCIALPFIGYGMKRLLCKVDKDGWDKNLQNVRFHKHDDKAINRRTSTLGAIFKWIPFSSRLVEKAFWTYVLLGLCSPFLISMLITNWLIKWMFKPDWESDPDWYKNVKGWVKMILSVVGAPFVGLFCLAVSLITLPFVGVGRLVRMVLKHGKQELKEVLGLNKQTDKDYYMKTRIFSPGWLKQKGYWQLFGLSVLWLPRFILKPIFYDEFAKEPGWFIKSDTFKCLFYSWNDGQEQHWWLRRGLRLGIEVQNDKRWYENGALRVGMLGWLLTLGILPLGLCSINLIYNDWKEGGWGIGKWFIRILFWDLQGECQEKTLYTWGENQNWFGRLGLALKLLLGVPFLGYFFTYKIEKRWHFWSAKFWGKFLSPILQFLFYSWKNDNSFVTKSWFQLWITGHQNADNLNFWDRLGAVFKLSIIGLCLLTGGILPGFIFLVYFAKAFISKTIQFLFYSWNKNNGFVKKSWFQLHPEAHDDNDGNKLTTWDRLGAIPKLLYILSSIATLGAIPLLRIALYTIIKDKQGWDFLKNLFVFWVIPSFQFLFYSSKKTWFVKTSLFQWRITPHKNDAINYWDRLGIITKIFLVVPPVLFITIIGIMAYHSIKQNTRNSNRQSHEEANNTNLAERAKAVAKDLLNFLCAAGLYLATLVLTVLSIPFAIPALIGYYSLDCLDLIRKNEDRERESEKIEPEIKQWATFVKNWAFSLFAGLTFVLPLIGIIWARFNDRRKWIFSETEHSPDSKKVYEWLQKNHQKNLKEFNQNVAGLKKSGELVKNEAVNNVNATTTADITRIFLADKVQLQKAKKQDDKHSCDDLHLRKLAKEKPFANDDRATINQKFREDLEKIKQKLQQRNFFNENTVDRENQGICAKEHNDNTASNKSLNGAGSAEENHAVQETTMRAY